jgi:hypothetical protein
MHWVSVDERDYTAKEQNLTDILQQESMPGKESSSAGFGGRLGNPDGLGGHLSHILIPNRMLQMAQLQFGSWFCRSKVEGLHQVMAFFLQRPKVMWTHMVRDREHTCVSVCLFLSFFLFLQSHGHGKFTLMTYLILITS